VRVGTQPQRLSADLDRAARRCGTRLKARGNATDEVVKVDGLRTQRERAVGGVGVREDEENFAIAGRAGEIFRCVACRDHRLPTLEMPPGSLRSARG
jgi:hypothetical protein